MMYDNTEKLPRAILVAVDTGEYDAETSLLELEELARTAGVEVAATSIQKRPAPDSATVVGSGRLRDLTEDLDRLEEMLSGDLLKLVIPKGVKLSEKRVRVGQNGPSKEQSEEKTESNGLAAQLLVNEYILLYFDSFLKKSESREELADQALDYEQEYLLCGKGSDRDYLAQTVEQLLMIRAAMNLLYLLNAADKKAQADGLAAAVSGGNAAAGLIIDFLILSLWALGEAVWDVRGLLDGGKTGFWKTDSTWHLSLDGLLAMEFLEGRPDMEASGSGYEDYIRILLFLEDKAVRNYRMMDVIQWNVRKKQKDFSTDACACEVEIRTEISQRHLFLMKSEYWQTVETAWAY